MIESAKNSVVGLLFFECTLLFACKRAHSPPPPRPHSPPSLPRRSTATGFFQDALTDELSEVKLTDQNGDDPYWPANVIFGMKAL